MRPGTGCETDGHGGKGRASLCWKGLGCDGPPLSVRGVLCRWVGQRGGAGGGERGLRGVLSLAQHGGGTPESDRAEGVPCSKERRDAAAQEGRLHLWRAPFTFNGEPQRQVVAFRGAAATWRELA